MAQHHWDKTNCPPTGAPALSHLQPVKRSPNFRIFEYLEGVKLLFVDDDRDTRALLVKVLRKAGADVSEAASAEEALEVLAEEDFDVLISDIGMPGTDGYEFMRRARRVLAGAGGREVPAIALTAFSRSEDRRAALSAGFQEHLAKPVDLTKLICKVAELVSPHRSACLGPVQGERSHDAPGC